MAIDPNISLQAKSPDMMEQVGRTLGVAQGAQNLQAARYALTQEQMQRVQNDFNSIAQDPDVALAANSRNAKEREEAGKRLIEKLKVHAEFAKQEGIPPQLVQNGLGPYIAAATLHPEQLQQMIAQRQQAGIGAAGQVAQTQIPVGAQQVPAGTNIQGMPVTQYKTQFGQTGIAPTPTAAGQMAPGLGQAQAVAGMQESARKDYEETSANATKASQNVGVLQNIKRLSKTAITGVTADRRSFVAGVAGLLGIDKEEIAKTDTDVLAKQVAMLSQSSGRTDAERALGEAATPNTKMTPEAINHAADQLIAQQEMALKKQNYFRKHFLNIQFDKGQGYVNALQQWNEAADPRILQLKSMSAEEKKAMMNSMSATERTDFIDKVRKAEKLGLTK